MPRLRGGAAARARLPNLYSVTFELVLGPTFDPKNHRARNELPTAYEARLQERIAVLEELYWANREEVRSWAHPGRRPWAWWHFEHPEGQGPHRANADEDQAVVLARMGELQPRELAELRRWASQGDRLLAETVSAIDAVLEQKET